MYQFRGRLTCGQGWQAALLPEAIQKPRFLLPGNTALLNPPGYNVLEHSKTPVMWSRSKKLSWISNLSLCAGCALALTGFLVCKGTALLFHFVGLLCGSQGILHLKMPWNCQVMYRCHAGHCPGELKSEQVGESPHGCPSTWSQCS